MVNKIRKAYDYCSALPGGRFLFSRFLGLYVPYSGTIYPEVQELKKGYARISIKDRRQVRNHLQSIHAIALMNLAELTTGLALYYDLSSKMRGILTHLEIDYLKKARGTITAQCYCDILVSEKECKYELIAEISDEKKAVVAKASATWLVGPKTKKSAKTADYKS
ncbi:MAG: DUF4442 domain-containing protein [bacterium]|nr:DUF4442 domain-containing protein [bacterium]